MDEITEPLETIRQTVWEVLDEFFGKTPPSKQPRLFDVSNADTETERIEPLLFEGDDSVSVRIVSEKPVITVARGSLTWGSTKTVVGSEPQLIVGRDKRRRSVTIKNLGLNNLAIDSNQNVKIGGVGGFGSGEIMGRDAITLDTTGDVWAIVETTADPVEVSIFQIFDDGQ